MEFNFSLIIVSLSLLISIIVAFVVLLNNGKSDTNKTFFAFAITTILWGAINFLNSQFNFSGKDSALLFLRLNIFFGLWQSFYLFRFFLIFPKEKAETKPWLTLVIWPVVIFTSVLIFTPFVFSSVTQFINGHIFEVKTEPGIAIFGLVATGFIVSGLIILFKKHLKFKKNKKKRTSLIIVGTAIMFFLIILFNLIFPNLLNNSTYVSISASFVLPFMILTGYSIIKYHLFNIKLIATQLITYFLWIFILVRTLMSNNWQDRVVDAVFFVVVIIIGLLLIKSVKKEVEQREKLEQLKIKLEAANEKLKSLDKLKTEFLGLASHQLRSPLTAIKGYTSMILEGDYGKINDEAKGVIKRIFQSSLNLAKIVEDLLNVSKIEQGGMKYEMAPFDLAKISKEIVDELSINAAKRGLKLTFKTDDEDKYKVNGDQNKIRQVILNLVDNSIKYTKKGSVNVTVTKKGGKILFSVADTGMGMTEEIKKSLFQKFSRGDGAMMNTSGSGLGLYLAKEIIEAHKGRIWVNSPGPGKGSTFNFELMEVSG